MKKRCEKDGVRRRWCVTKRCVKDDVCVYDKVVCERWCVTKWCVKDRVSQMVGDKVVCERWCARYGV